jgi:trk system potassium uptake protein TrkA
MRIIIVGGDEIGFQLARELTGLHDVIVIEDDPDVACRFNSLDLQVIPGNPTQPEVLRAAYLKENDTFIACSASDELNLIACLAARQVARAQTFCFVSKEEYYNSFTSFDGKEPVLAIDRVIWPQHMMASEIARIVLIPRAIDVEFFAGGRVWLLEYRLRKTSPLLDRPLSELKLPKGVLAVAVTTDERLSIPTGSTRLQEADKVAFMGKEKPLLKLQQDFIPDAQRKVRDVTILGGGTVGLTIAKLLRHRDDLRLKIIEKSAERCKTLAVELPSALVLQGDGTDLELLEAEQINRTDVLVSVTTNDEKNLLASLLAKQMKIPKIITRVDKLANLRLFESVGIDVPINMYAMAIEMVANSLQKTNVQMLSSVEQGKGDVLELVVPASFPATKLKSMRRIEGAIIAAILRNNQTIVPHGEDVVKAGDQLLVVCTEDARQAVRSYF